MSASTQRGRIVWIPEDEPGIEDVWILHEHTGETVFESLLGRLWEGLPLRVAYLLVCDSEWRVRSLVASADCETVGAPTLRLKSDGAGTWKDGDGNALPELHGCIDVDFMLTPLTNTLPIKRLALAPGESREITVVYISAPNLDVRPFRQRYTRLADAAGMQQYRYESLDGSGFTAVLPVDADGYVLDYLAIWRRLWPR